MTDQLRPPGYDGYADAVDRGIDVGFVPLERSAVLWLPDYRAVLVDSTMPERERHAALAHALAHATIEDTPIVRLARAGVVPRESVERLVHKISARAQVSAPALLAALEHCRTASAAASRLGITPGTLCWRLIHLEDEEEARIPAELIDRLEWDVPVADDLCCIWPDPVLESRSSAMSMLADVARWALHVCLAKVLPG